MAAHWKPSTGQKIEKIYAWIAIEADGGEGIPAIQLGETWFPLIGANRERMESFRQAAENAARATGQPVQLKMFSTITIIDEVSV